MAVKMDGLAAAIAEALEEFEQESMDILKSSTDIAASACVKELKVNSPVLTGDYSKGWTKKVAYESAVDIRVQVYNKTDWQLTHLLEDGHANAWDGGSTPAHPHIQPAADKASKLLEKTVRIKVGGK